MKLKYFIFTQSKEISELFDKEFNKSAYDFWVLDNDKFQRAKLVSEREGYVFVHRDSQVIKDQEYITYQCCPLWDYIDNH